MSETGNIDVGMPSEGGSGAPEQLSEAAKARFAAAGAAMAQIQREEKRSKKRDARVARAIIQFLNDDKYAHLFVLISRLVARDCPSVFILAVLSLINDESASVVQEYLQEMGQKTSKETADEEVQSTYDQYREGLLTEEERKNRVVEIWAEVSEKISKGVSSTVKDHSPVHYMVTSGARGSLSQVTQMSGMKGLVVNPAGDVIELPVKGSFKEGLQVLEYFISTHGSRKGMSDTALRTADAGYLTRRLVDVAQDMVVNAEDCGTEEYDIVSLEDSQRMNKPFEKRLFGRVTAEDVVVDGKVLLQKNQGIDDITSEKIANSGLVEVKCRSVLKCKLPRGMCRLCYGYDLGFNRMVNLGAAVGIVAAQAIGEPGTQLTMRTFHTGGSAAVKDITQGLPRVEELFECREPKGQATLTEIDGQVYISKLSVSNLLIFSWIKFKISSVDSFSILRPHSIQNGFPTRAYSTRK
jgi:DNA-directed RNA polymerase beta' subunit